MNCPKSEMKIITKGITCITIIFALFMAVFIVPGFFGVKPYVILSGSMEPQIPTGSVVFIDTNDRDVVIDDIIAYRLGDAATVTHRAIEVSDGFITTKGDNNDVQDANPVPFDHVIGTYRFHIPQVGYYMNSFNMKQKTALIIIIALANMIAFGYDFMASGDDDEDEDKPDDTPEEAAEVKMIEMKDDSMESFPDEE